MDREKVIETIQKLLRLRDGTNSQAEEESAAAKVQELLFKYNLEMAEVDAHVPESEKQERVGESFTGVDERKNEGTWVTQLYNIVAQYNFCKVLIMGNDWENRKGSFVPRRITIIGKATNVEIVRYTCEQLLPRIRSLAAQEWKYYTGHEKRGMFTRGFLAGCVTGISNRLYEEWQKFQRTDEKSQALVLVRDAEIKEYLSIQYPHIRRGKGSRSRSYDGYSTGVMVGRSMDIRRGVSSGERQRLPG